MRFLHNNNKIYRKIKCKIVKLISKIIIKKTKKLLYKIRIHMKIYKINNKKIIILILKHKNHNKSNK